MHERAPKWERWDHEVVGWVGDKLVPIPVNINTVNRLFDLAGKVPTSQQRSAAVSSGQQWSAAVSSGQQQSAAVSRLD